MDTSGESVSDARLRRSGGVAGYVGGWRVSLRLAARDLRAHKGRAILVALLIGLPLFLVAGGATFGFTVDVNAREGITRTMGNGQALLSFMSGPGQVVQQSADGQTGGTGDGPGVPEPLYFPGKPAHPGAADIQRVTGGTVLPVTDARVRVRIGDRAIGANVLGIDGRRSAYTGMARLTSGHWPTSESQVLVSRSGAAHGLPTSGTLTLDDGTGHTRDVTVVGRADTPNAEELVALPRGRAGTWILQRSTPVGWSEVRQLNRYGLLVESRQVLDHPAQANADPEAGGLDGGSGVPGTIWVLLGTGLVVIIALLAGPAFASSGARHRRELAQLASNGASKRQLRQFVLAQAVLLGVCSAFVFIVAGALAGGAVATVTGHWMPTKAAPGPLDLRWGWGVLLFAIAVIAALISAFLPAVAASRVNLIAVLRGHVSIQRVHFGWPLLGVAVATAGGAVVIAAFVRTGARAAEVPPALTALLVVGAVALFAGTLMTAPWLLTRLGMLARHLPLAWRIAARDVGRQRGRAVATTGAILATVAALTTLLIGMASSENASRDAYQPSLPAGQGVVSLMGGKADAASALSVVRHAIPDATVVTLHTVGASGMDPTESRKVFAAYTGGCRDAQALKLSFRGTSTGSCKPSVDLTEAGLLAATPEQAARIFRLSDRDVAALRSGRVLLPAGAKQSSMRIVAGHKNGKRFVVSGAVTLPVQASTQGVFSIMPPKPDAYSSYGATVEAPALVSTEAARRIPGGNFVRSILVRAPGGISQSAQRAIEERLNNDSYLYVERGYPATGRWVYLLIGGVFGLLVLVATLTSTALSNAESRADTATLASLGAPASLRRRIAGANAALIGLFGALLGLIVGLVAGFAVSHPVTIVSSPNSRHAVTAIPWLELLVVAIGVPLLAAALAALATRGRVPMTRRLS